MNASRASRRAVAKTLRRSEHVVATVNGGDVVLMDLRRGQYHTLNAVATRVWELLAFNTSIDAIVEGIRTEFALPTGMAADAIRTDIESILDDWWHADMLVDASLPTQRAAGHAATRARPSKAQDSPRPLECALLIAAIKARLRFRGVEETLHWIRRARRAPIIETDRRDEMVRAADTAVARAAAFYPGRAQCLERSLVLWHTLLHRGIDAMLCLGVHTDPFKAHAWVEYDGRPANEVPEYLDHYLRFPPLG
jgi:hypothetical protein